MTFSNIRPFVRHAQIITINEKMKFHNVMACDHRLFCVKRGTDAFFVNNKSYAASVGTLIIWCVGIEYSLINGDGDELELVGLSFDLDFLNSDKQTPIPPSARGDFVREKFSAEVIRYSPTLSIRMTETTLSTSF